MSKDSFTVGQDVECDHRQFGRWENAEIVKKINDETYTVYMNGGPYEGDEFDVNVGLIRAVGSSKSSSGALLVEVEEESTVGEAYLFPRGGSKSGGYVYKDDEIRPYLESSGKWVVSSNIIIDLTTGNKRVMDDRTLREHSGDRFRVFYDSNSIYPESSSADGVVKDGCFWKKASSGSKYEEWEVSGDIPIGVQAFLISLERR